MLLDPRIEAAFIGAIIAGVFAFVVGWLTHRRDVRRRDLEWSREKLLESYSNCIYYLVKLGISSMSKSTEDKDVRQHFSEAQRYLNLLRAYHSPSDVAVEKLRTCNQNLAANWNKTKELSEVADNAVEDVKRIMENDEHFNLSRVSSKSSPYLLQRLKKKLKR